jgi:archaellum component FlaC
MSSDTDIEQLNDRMTNIEKSLNTIKEDLHTVIQTLGRASTHCSFLRLEDDD